MNKLRSPLFCSVLVLSSFLSFGFAHADAGNNFSAALTHNNTQGSKLDSMLQRLVSQAVPTGSTRQLNRAAPLPNDQTTAQAITPDVSDGYVLIEAVATDDPKQLAEKLTAMGMKNVNRFGRLVSGRFPVDQLAELEGMTVLKFARHTLAIKNQGIATTQGDIAMRSDLARQAFIVSGSRVNVGVLSDSYNCFGGAAAGVDSGDLPSDVNVLQEAFCSAADTDEGRAMLEIVHDVAPEASLMFHTANGGMPAFANGILALADAGADVIADDIRYLTEPFFQDGIIAQAVDQVNREQDVAYFSAAGNDGRDSYESRYREERNSGLFNFASRGKPADVCLEVEITPGQLIIPVLQWDDPFFSVSGGEGAKTDLRMAFFQSCEPDAALIDDGNFPNIGGDPLDGNFILNPTVNPITIGIVIERLAGPEPGRIKLVTNGGTIVDSNATQSGTSYGHSIARGAMGVGASLFIQTPPFFSDPAEINDYSSAGGTRILFDTNGKRLKRPERRKQPAIVGPDGVDTSFFGVQVADGTEFPNFFGTSASTPHVAAVAALMRSHNPYASADEIYRTLTRTAEDMDDPATLRIFDVGYDTGTGYGFINANAAISAISPPASWYCDGQLATIIGSNKSETLHGTAGDDIIVGLNGDDRILGNGGNDLICGGRGNDTIRSGKGDDIVFGDNGDDKIFTEQGDDKAYGGQGNDHIVGGENDDELYGDKGRDLLLGQQGDDLIDGGKGYDEATGGPGYDNCDAELTSKCE